MGSELVGQGGGCPPLVPLCCRLLAAGLLNLAADPVRFAADVTGLCGDRERGGAKGQGGNDGSDQDGGVLFHCEIPPVLIRELPGFVLYTPRSVPHMHVLLISICYDAERS